MTDPLYGEFRPISGYLMRFQELGLLPELVSNAGYETATPVQFQAIPAVLEGRDVLAGAQTGTGKTAAFMLPILQKLMAGESTGCARALVLAPTRELAAQVADSVRKYGRGLKLRHTCIFGGVNYGGQMKAIRGGLDILVATPGRLLDHVNQRTIDLSQVKTLVLDEADRMLDMGFIGDIEKIISKCQPKHQTLLFSATYNKGIKNLSGQYLNNPIEIAVAKDNTVAASVEQTFVRVDKERKRDLLMQLIRMNEMHQVLVFTKTKFGADKLSRALTDDGLPAVAMHGNKTQAQRTKALQKFKRGDARILVATDVAARGLDIQKLPHVINFELPMVAEDYIHRIGRTGRAGETGAAISLVSADEHGLLLDIQRVLKVEVSFEVADGFEPRTPFPTRKPKQKSRPKSHGNYGGNARGGNSQGRSSRPGGERSDSRPARSNGERSDSRPARSNGERSDSRPARSNGERSDSRPARSNGERSDSRPARSNGERSDSRPARDAGSQNRNPRQARDGSSAPVRKTRTSTSSDRSRPVR
ncbi:DEAD/DEAH box helicase [Litorivicinus sp.]|nr:DEAD/DEAH box helicase [Litorivicinus sp.]